MSMTGARRKFTQESKDELCREMINTSKSIKDVVYAHGVGTETKLTVAERARFTDLEREFYSSRPRVHSQKAAVYFALEQR